MDFIIVSGLSGAGKSKTVSFLEDIGYYCVDNLPGRPDSEICRAVHGGHREI